MPRVLQKGQEEKMTANPKLEELAESHAEWAAQFFKWAYKQAFLHGYKHGKEDKK